MKILVLALLMILAITASAQRKESGGTILLLSKRDSSRPGALMVNPNKAIKLGTANGKSLKLSEFTILGDSAIASTKDTIALKEIVFLKAAVKGDHLRKVGGGILNLAGALPAAAIAIGGMMNIVFGGSPKLLVYALPGIGIASIGAALTGARRFDTAEIWELSVSSGNIKDYQLIKL